MLLLRVGVTGGGVAVTNIAAPGLDNNLEGVKGGLLEVAEPDEAAAACC